LKIPCFGIFELRFRRLTEGTSWPALLSVAGPSRDCAFNFAPRMYSGVTLKTTDLKRTILGGSMFGFECATAE
jgi:hypothetical protein